MLLPMIAPRALLSALSRLDERHPEMKASPESDVSTGSAREDALDCSLFVHPDAPRGRPRVDGTCSAAW
jgi:hypothetical protein